MIKLCKIGLLLLVLSIALSSVHSLPDRKVFRPACSGQVWTVSQARIWGAVRFIFCCKDPRPKTKRKICRCFRRHFYKSGTWKAIKYNLVNWLALLAKRGKSKARTWRTKINNIPDACWQRFYSKLDNAGNSNSIVSAYELCRYFLPKLKTNYLCRPTHKRK